MSVDSRAQAVERITAAERPQARRTLRRDGVTFHIERAQTNDAGRSAEVLDLRFWVGPAAKQHSERKPPRAPPGSWSRSSRLVGGANLSARPQPAAGRYPGFAEATTASAWKR